MKDSHRNSYFMQIVTRATGTPMLTPIKPITHSWSFRNTEDSSNPFEDNIKALESDKTGFSPGQINLIENTDFQSEEQNFKGTILSKSPSYKEAHPLDKPIADNTNRKKKSSTDVEIINNKTTQISDTSKDQKHTFLRHHSSGDEEVKSINMEKPIATKNDKEFNKQASRTKDNGEIIFSPNKLNRQILFETRIVHNQPPEQNLQFNNGLLEEQIIQQSNKSKLEPAKRSTTKSVVSELSSNGSNAKSIKNRRNNVPVHEIRPPKPTRSTSPPSLKKDKTEPRLVIGRLKVEVVPPPVEKKKEAILATSRTIKPQPIISKSISNNKLRFGLGQI